MVTVKLGTKTEEKPFPKLMKSPKGYVVYFIKESCGVVLAVGNGGFRSLGNYYDDLNMDAFTDYNEPVTLQNA